MGYQLRAGVILLATFAGLGFALAQRAPGTAPGDLDLSQTQREAIMRGLKSEPTQSSPEGAQAQVGTKAPDAMMTKQMPGNVTAEVPATKNLLFVKLPGRVLLIDPDTRMVSEVILETEGASR
jgi:hypothetical protein